MVMGGMRVGGDMEHMGLCSDNSWVVGLRILVFPSVLFSFLTFLSFHFLCKYKYYLNRLTYYFFDIRRDSAKGPRLA